MDTPRAWKGVAVLIVLALAIYIALVLTGYIAWSYSPPNDASAQVIDPTPRQATITGTYGCLPHANPTGPQTDECAFGIHTDDDVWYAVNFGQSANAMQQFQAGAHVALSGFVVPKEALSSDHWMQYDMKGIFTATTPATTSTPLQTGKLDIRAVCQGALAYMTFPDAARSDAFVESCISGEHPEVIEHYKAQLGTDGAAI